MMDFNIELHKTLKYCKLKEMWVIIRSEHYIPTHIYNINSLREFVSNCRSSCGPAREKVVPEHDPDPRKGVARQASDVVPTALLNQYSSLHEFAVIISQKQFEIV